MESIGGNRTLVSGVLRELRQKAHFFHGDAADDAWSGEGRRGEGEALHHDLVLGSIAPASCRDVGVDKKLVVVVVRLKSCTLMHCSIAATASFSSPQ